MMKSIFKNIVNRIKNLFLKARHVVKQIILGLFRNIKKACASIIKFICLILQKTYKWILKYTLFLIFLITCFLCKRIEIDEKYLNGVADIILSLLPMIFTIIVISLSLPSEKIYGITNIEFRRIRKDICFSFVEMIFITIFIFILYTVFKIFNMVLFIWTLDLISVLYSIWFIAQEIPILIKKDSKIIKIIKQAWNQRERNILIESTKSDNDLVIAVQNVILKHGIVRTYKYFKTNNKIKNKELLDSLLSLNNEYFFEFTDKIDLIIGTSPESYKNIMITEAIDMSFANLDNLLKFNDDFNIVEVYEDARHFYQLTRLVFNLKKITDKYNSKDKFTNEMRKILQTVFVVLNYQKINDNCKKFVYSFLNAITVITISENDFWFVKAIRDSRYNSRFIIGEHDEYYYFLSIYFYYLYAYDKRVTEELKNSIKNFINEEADGINADGSSWLKIFQHQMEYTKYSKLISLLPELLKILDKDTSPWYQPKHCTCWSSEDGFFSNNLIIRCWLELLLFNYNNYQYVEKDFNIVADELNDTERHTFAVELNEHWFKDNMLNINLKEESFLDFYKSKQGTSVRDEDNIVKELKEIKTEILLKDIQKEFTEAQINEGHIIELRTKLIDGFNAAKSQISVYDKDIDLKEEPFVCYDLFFDTRWNDRIIDDYTKKFPEALKKIIYDDFKNNNNIKVEKINKKSNKNDVYNLIKKYKLKGGNEYLLYKIFSDYNPSCLYGKDKIDLYLPYFTVLNENAIKFNLICDEKQCFVRRLNSYEINGIIDRDYKIINGLYKYCESRDDSRSVFITREQIYDLLEKKYFYAKIVFKYKIIFDYDNILALDEE